MNLSALVITTEKHVSTRCSAVIQTWGQDMDRILFASDHDSPPNFYKASEDSSYYSAEEKMTNGLLYFEDEEFDWLFICDDDTFCNVKNIRAFIDGLDKDRLGCYGHTDRTYRERPDLLYASGGAGFVISKKTHGAICKVIMSNDLPAVGWSDVRFGLYCEIAGVEMIDSDLFKWDTPVSLGIQDVSLYVSFHHIDKGEMIRLYKETNQ